MLRLEQSSLSRKLALVSMLSTGSALLCVLVAVAATSVLSHQAGEARHLAALAGVIGDSGASALQARDRRQAEQALRALADEDEISAAALFDRQGRLLAQYRPAAPDEAPAALADLGADAVDALGAAAAVERRGPPWAPGLRLYRAVESRQGRVGAVMLDAELGALWPDVARQLGAAGAAGALSLLVAQWLATRFKRSIADPLAQLIGAAQQVSSSPTYTHRIAHRRSDELGLLIDSFNHMLSQIESRDATLADYRGQLEQQVGVRTEQLEKAKNAAEAASQAKSAFLATMSHEIRTPMNGVLGMTELLLASQLSEQQRHYTNMVKRSGEHLLVIINDILDFSKIEAGKLTVEYIHFNVRELLDDVDHVFSPQAQAKGLALELAVAQDIPIALCGDPNRLRQVIVNLLGNAIKFTDAGTIRVQVAIAAEDAQAVGLRFEVHDTGIGVSSEARARIFDSFSQADGSTTRKHGGTGLGLSISKQLVELMGGNIGVNNAVAQGSVFWFTVNFDKRRVDADDLSFLPKTIQGLRALIVDDKQAPRAALERQLGRWQVHTDSAATAADALQRLREAAERGQPYDVALLDMELPRTSGLALAATIKAEPALATLRLVLLSSKRDAADPVQRRAAGVAFQLIKPARPCDLFDSLAAPSRVKEGLRPLAPHVARPSVRRQRRRILLAEDNPVNVEVATAMLEGLGLDVVHTDNGAQACDAARAEDFDLILMDCQMPVMDGFAATSEIRRHEQQLGRARLLPIVAITANALQGDRESCLAAGMDDYLSKPFTQQALGDTIGRWIALPRAAAAHHTEAAPAPPRRAAPPAPPVAPARAQPDRPPRAPGATAASPSQSASQSASGPAARAPSRAAGHDGINRVALHNIRALSADAGAALLARVIHAFVTDTPRHLQTLRQAIAGADSGAIRRAAHSLKSSSANVGADALAQLCRDMEALGRADSVHGAPVLLAAMEQEFHAVRHSLGAILEKET